MEQKTITIYPELIEDLLLYILVAVLLCLVCKAVHDWKEKRRLRREFAAYQQQKAEEN